MTSAFSCLTPLNSCCSVSLNSASAYPHSHWPSYCQWRSIHIEAANIALRMPAYQEKALSARLWAHKVLPSADLAIKQQFLHTSNVYGVYHCLNADWAQDTWHCDFCKQLSLAGLSALACTLLGAATNDAALARDVWVSTVKFLVLHYRGLPPQ